MNYKTLEDAITRWAAAERMVQALMVIGSRAREDHTADAWSDLDLILFVTDSQAYVEDPSWLASFGEVWLRVLNFTGAGDPEWMVLYAGGFKVDFILAPLTGQMSDMLSASFYTLATRRGVRVLLDKEGESFLGTARPAVGTEWEQPTPEEFTAVLNQFWLSIYRASNMLLRGELWRARNITDSQIRQQILCMLEWHAKVVNGRAYDTWYDGRFLADWVDPQLLPLLPQIFGPFDVPGTRRVISASMTVMDSLGRQTAEKWSYPYPIENQTHIQEWIEASLLVG
jgi:aminoglycoside 6-adenylyltransferase